jgi:hypothetical protein
MGRSMRVPQKAKNSWAPVVHACNPSYSGKRDQEDRSLKPARANTSLDPISKKTHYKKGAGGVAQGVVLKFKPQSCKKKKK